jgi:integrase
MPRRKPPAYLLHQASGQARVRIDGRDYYLGPYGSPQSHAAYEAKLTQWKTGDIVLPPSGTDAPSLVYAMMRFMTERAQTYYAGKPEFGHFRVLVRFIMSQPGFCQLAAADLTAKRLEQLQAAMLHASWSRNHANRQTTRIKTMARWLEKEKLLPEGRWASLCTVRALPEDEEADQVLPVPEDDLARTMAQLGPVPLAITDTLLLTAARPGEILKLRPGDLITNGRVQLAPGFTLDLNGCWAYTPKRYKTVGRKGKSFRRIILFGPRAQLKLTPFLEGRPANKPIFSPREAAEDYYRSKGQRVNHCRGRAPGEQYRHTSYAHAITAACARAGVPHWSPGQLRHNAATRLVEQFGWEIAAQILGHASVDMTRQYVLRRLTAAVEAMREVG